MAEILTATFDGVEEQTILDINDCFGIETPEQLANYCEKTFLTELVSKLIYKQKALRTEELKGLKFKTRVAVIEAEPINIKGD